jgi:hypothetical protein
MALIVAMLVAGWWFGIRPTKLGSQTIVNFELAGSTSVAKSLVGKQVGAFRSALWKDFFFIAGYGAALVGASLVASRLFLTSAGRRLGWLSFAAAIAIVACDVAENIFLLRGLSALDSTSSWRFQWAAGAATVKFSLLVIVLPVALLTVLAVVKRYLGSLKCDRGVTNMTRDGSLPWPVQTARGDEWTALSATADAARPPDPNGYGRQHNRDAAVVPKDRPLGEVGFCLSGGGIRSGCVALGALQELRERLLGARYLVSVSGGGYMSGAMQLALYPDPPQDKDEPISTALPGDVYEHGSVEEDHTRRHGNYIADGARQWLVALGVLGRGLLASMSVISATVITIGIALSYFYKSIPLVELGPTAGNPRGLAAYFRGVPCKEFADGKSHCLPPSFPRPLGSVGWTALWVTVAAGFVWLAYVSLIDMDGKTSLRKLLQRSSRALWAVGALLATIVFLIPTTLWLVTRLTYIVAPDGKAGTGVAGAGRSALGTILLAYGGSIASIVWRQRKKISSTVEEARGKKGGSGQALTAAVPHGLGQSVIVWAALAVLLAANVILLASTVITADLWSFWVRLGIPVGLLLIFALVDQTWMSLHPFYRRRLASALSVRRVKRNNRAVARPYDFDTESTPLYKYGRRIPSSSDSETDEGAHTAVEMREASSTKPSQWPQVIFACAANVSGSNRTPPGRRAVSFTLSHDYIGGPDVGYAPTQELTKALSGPLAADLTVQAAVAISGAAFASAMGRQARAFQTLLAISNARLGSWLPNPAYLYDISRDDAQWWLPGMPRIRRLPYLFREIFGQLPPDNRLLLITDGGHYENLGLVELVRHRCRTIFCIDASGDTPPFPQTLNQAIALAWEELGVKVCLEGSLDLVPGSAEPLAPENPLKGLSERLSATAVAKGTITYPEPFEDGSDKGTLIFAKALLTPGMSAELLAYAQAEEIFPRDSTGDQWFSADQFDAYQSLGRYIGKEAETLWRASERTATKTLEERGR